MNNKNLIKQLLVDINNDITKIVELEKYNIDDIIEIALNEKLYDSLLIIFKPVTINGITKIYFDAFSTDILEKLNNSCGTIEEAKKEARIRYERNKSLNDFFIELDPESILNEESYEDILSSIRIIPKNTKEKIINSLFSIDLNLIEKIKIKNSHARRISGIGHPIKNINDVIFYAEPACLKPCIELFKKNIITTMNDTDCVIEDFPTDKGKCFITCNYNFLSEENKEIFNNLIEIGVVRKFIDGSINSISISVPCNGEETVGEVSNKLLSIVSQLKIQDYTYGKYTLDSFYNDKLENLGYYNPELYNKYFDKEECTWDDVINFAREFGYYYDSNENILWECEEYYNMHKNYLLGLDSQSNIPPKL